jgi:small subunit ribosomal protein S2
VAENFARDLINAGVHFGHGASRWNPKMRPYIASKRGDTHIIDVKKTVAGVIVAKKLLAEVVASGKDVVFVGTKRQAKNAVKTVAESCGMHYVNTRWLGGTLTNFRTIRSRLQRLVQLETMADDGQLGAESKKHASRLKREMRKIKTNLEGIREMSRLPGAIVAIDAKQEYLALHEAKKLLIPSVAVIDTDSDPDTVDVPIPANDDSIRAIELILDQLGEGVKAGKAMAAVKPEAPRPKRRVSKRPVLARAGEPAGQPEETPQGDQAQEPQGEPAGGQDRARPAEKPQ